MVDLNNNPFFKVLFSAKFSHAQLVINWNPEKRELPLELTQKINSFWEKEIVETGKNHFIFNGELCRLNDWRVQKDQLTLDLGFTDYNELLYANQFTNDIAERFGKDSLARALGVSVVLVSDDEQIILIKRSKAVGENPGDLDVLGGHIHPQENARVPLTNLQNKKSCGTCLQAVPIPNEQRPSGSPESYAAPPKMSEGHSAAQLRIKSCQYGERRSCQILDCFKPNK